MGPEMSLSKEALVNAKRKMELLDNEDKELKNNFDAYIYGKVKDWLYTDGEDVSTTEFQKHLDSLKCEVDDFFGV
ncbi:heat shock 70 kDa protein 17-like [Impatiens glandulifera]|uniref:heat shock 70 kDa protein 17-like n=1 Tax=Impatiens glandulifera TaxID=253017 RepID=UPI001FB0F9CB|nr:heat shock 70 kDa protein 17-like [Impatiens glandulifera]